MKAGRGLKRVASSRIIGHKTLEDVAAEICELAREKLDIPDSIRETFAVYRFMQGPKTGRFRFIWQRFLNIKDRERRRYRRHVDIEEGEIAAPPDPPTDDGDDYGKFRERLLQAARRRKSLLWLINYLLLPQGCREDFGSHREIAELIQLGEAR